MKSLKRLLLFTVVCITAATAAAQQVNIIPYPENIVVGSERFKLQDKTFSLNLKGRDGRMLASYVVQSELKLQKVKKNASVRFILDRKDPQMESSEAYRLQVHKGGIDICASAPAGLFYGFQTLLQLARPEMHIRHVGDKGFREPTGNFVVPYVQIMDSPRFGWRGVHFDVSRHFFSKEHLMKQMRMMARYKLNRMHWHLTDDPGWRLEIKSYPKLTETAYRPQRTWDDWGKSGQQFSFSQPLESSLFGGYYTREDVKEILNYAEQLHITVVPEIEMPGHSWEVLAAYPELGCSGKPYQNSELCIGNEQTFVFLERVLDEVIHLFPSKYIHIGGDEANRSHWAACPKCQKRMKDEGLNDVKELQSYLTRRIERYLEKKGRKLMGWDEIIEGGLSPGATVMSWRGEEGGIHAAQTGHDAVMTPWMCYLDNAQDDPTIEPRGVGGYVPLKKTYDYDPVPAALTPTEAKHILGVQGNLWTEHVSTEAHAEYMYYPRLCAIAEDGWTPNGQKNWERFHATALNEVQWLKSHGYNAFNLAEEKGDRKEALDTLDHLARGKHVIYTNAYSPKYRAAGDVTLVDGLRGSFTYQDGRWQGVETKDFEVVIDLGSVQDIHRVQAEFMQRYDQWIWMPHDVIVSVSDNGTDFREIHHETCDIEPENPAIMYRNFGWQGSDRARFVRFTAVANGRQGGWLFTDEIIVE